MIRSMAMNLYEVKMKARTKEQERMRLTRSSVPISQGLFQLLLQFPTVLLTGNLQVGQSGQRLLQL